jgi:MscS family membrane protein
MTPGSTLIRTVLLALGLLAWASGAAAQAESASSGGERGGEPSAGGSSGGPSDAWFEVERLNAGLPPAPAAMDRSTPMGAMETFLAAVRADRFAEAAHLLDLSRIPVEAQAERGPDLARKLGVILENHVWIDWDALPDRPDALLQPAAGNDPLAGQMQRSLVVDRLDIDDHAVPLRLNRLKPEGQEPAWVFSRHSVDNIDALYALYGPGWLAEVIPRAWQEQSSLSWSGGSSSPRPRWSSRPRARSSS